jgi:hypothetical protein
MQASVKTARHTESSAGVFPEMETDTLFQFVGTREILLGGKIREKVRNLETRRKVETSVSQFGCKPSSVLAVDVFGYNLRDIVDEHFDVTGKLPDIDLSLNIHVAIAETQGRDGEIPIAQMLNRVNFIQSLLKIADQLIPGLAEALGKQGGQLQMSVAAISKTVTQIQTLLKAGINTPEQRQQLVTQIKALQTNASKLSAIPGMKTMAATMLQHVQVLLKQVNQLTLQSPQVRNGVMPPRVAATLNNGKAQGIFVDPKSPQPLNAILPRLSADPLARLALNQLHTLTRAPAADAARVSSGLSQTVDAGRPGIAASAPVLGTAAALAGAVVLSATTANSPAQPTITSIQGNPVAHVEMAPLEKAVPASAATANAAVQQEASKDASANVSGVTVNSSVESVKAEAAQTVTAATNNANAAQQADLPNQNNPNSVQAAQTETLKAPEGAKSEMVAEVAKQENTGVEKGNVLDAPERPTGEPILLKTSHDQDAQAQEGFKGAEVAQNNSLNQDSTSVVPTAHANISITTSSLLIDHVSLQLANMANRAEEDLERLKKNFKINAKGMCEDCPNGGDCIRCSRRSGGQNYNMSAEEKWVAQKLANIANKAAPRLQRG